MGPGDTVLAVPDDTVNGLGREAVPAATVAPDAGLGNVGVAAPAIPFAVVAEVQRDAVALLVENLLSEAPELVAG
jgi:hypothetical protein